MELPLEVTPAAVRQLLDIGAAVHLVDVREPAEYEQARIEGSELIPLASIPAFLPTLQAKAKEVPLVILCHHGVRSLNAVSWLRARGVSACQSMAGGIDRWSQEVDPAVPRYF